MFYYWLIWMSVVHLLLWLRLSVEMEPYPQPGERPSNCQHCRYDLNAIPNAHVCPECGHAIEFVPQGLKRITQWQRLRWAPFITLLAIGMLALLSRHLPNVSLPAYFNIRALGYPHHVARCVASKYDYETPTYPELIALFTFPLASIARRVWLPLLVLVAALLAPVLFAIAF